MAYMTCGTRRGREGPRALLASGGGAGMLLVLSKHEGQYGRERTEADLGKQILEAEALL